MSVFSSASEALRAFCESLGFNPYEVPTSLEGLDLCFHMDLLAVACVKGRTEDFSQIGVDQRRAFDPMPNVINTESVPFDYSDVGFRMVEAMVLPRDQHAMRHSKETTKDFAKKLFESLGLVSHLTYHIHVPCFLLFFFDTLFSTDFHFSP